MKYCKKCVQPDTRPGVTFDSEGICHACRYSEKIVEIDWAKREVELREIATWAKNNRSKFMTPDNNNYDCIIGVSGGKDGTFQALHARDVLGLNCLLVNYAPSDITELGKKNMNNLYQLGFDVMKFLPKPNTEKLLAKNCFYKYGNIVKASEYVLYATVMRVAVAFKIPFVIWGENPATYIGAEVNIIGDTGDAINVIYHNTTAGGFAKDLLFDGLKPEDLVFYQYPSREEIQQINMKYIFLGHYVKEWSAHYNAKFSIDRGLNVRTEKLEEIGSLRNYQALDSDVSIVNQILKYFKMGFGIATDQACLEIRERRLTREEAVKLVHKYDGKCSLKYIEEFCKFIGISLSEFWRVAESFRNLNIWEKVNNEWKLKVPLE
jgi:N-acetyl sugar amidotransferase